ncbi:MAG: glycosyltransferase family 4 protein [Bryobacteraceae bacterium]
MEHLPVRLLGFLNITPIKQIWLGVSAFGALLAWSICAGWNWPKVICCYNLTVPPVILLWMAAKLGRSQLIPIVCDINIPGETVPDTKPNRFDFAQHKFWLPRMDRVVAVTDAMIHDFAPDLPHLILEGGLTLADESAAVKTEPQNGPGPFTAIMAGSLDECNGVRIAVEALRLAPDLEIRLVIAGDGPLREFVQTAAQADERICYMGFLSHKAVLDLYRRADLLLNLRITRQVRTPYFFPGKLLEYLSSGTAVLSTDCSHVRRRYSGLLYLTSGEDAQAIATDLQNISALPEADRRLVAGRAQEWMMAHMTWNQQGQRLVKFFAGCNFGDKRRPNPSEVTARCTSKAADQATTGATHTVLVLADYYVPGYKAGGPLRSIYNMIEALGSEFRFRVMTRDRDLGDSEPYPQVRYGQWVRNGKGDILYLEPGLRGIWRLVRELLHSNADLIYLNSFFSRKFSILPSLLWFSGLVKGVPMLLAPRGEFSLGALELKSRRKRCFLHAMNRVGLYRECVWHASSRFEAADINREIRPQRITITSILRRFGGVPRNSVFTATPVAFVASDMSNGEVTGPPLPRIRSKQAGGAEFAFLSRIDRMKNLTGAIGMLKSLRGNAELHVYGPCDDVLYLAECKETESTLPKNVSVIWHGGIPHDDVNRCLSQHHFFLLPTKGENYGHVILEALSASCPVIVSDQTPWRHLDELGVGWDLPLNSAQFTAVLQECVDMEDERFQDLSARAYSFGLNCQNAPTALADNRKMLMTILAPRNEWKGK